jgi:hypothetical protein
MTHNFPCRLVPKTKYLQTPESVQRRQLRLHLIFFEENVVVLVGLERWI